MLGWRTVCAVEIGRFQRNVLLARQRDGVLDRFPIWDDVRTFDGGQWRGKVDVISGGFPCQDISSAGRGLGIERGEQSGLWREYARIIREVRPRFVFVENSAMLTVRGLGIVLGDLAEAGYDAAWKVLSAGDCGAPHERKRMWIVGKISDTDCLRKQQSQRTESEVWRRACGVCSEVSYADNDGFQISVSTRKAEGQISFCDRERRYKDTKVCDSSIEGFSYCKWETGEVDEQEAKQELERSDPLSWKCEWWKAEPGLGRVADGVANRVDRIKAIGNGQVPLVAARAFCELIDELEKKQRTHK